MSDTERLASERKRAALLLWRTRQVRKILREIDSDVPLAVWEAEVRLACAIEEFTK
jgi:hypothetical protein